MYLRPTHPCSILFLVVALALFFGLFFGLNYPEIVRHGYCCETSCDTSRCSSAPSGSSACNPLISQLDNGYSPSSCAANSSACPPGVGSICDGGYYCCDTCCSTCTSCTTVCSGKSSCTPSCTTYSCNCYCCSSSSHLRCTLSCPICFQVDLSLSYRTKGGIPVNNVSYVQDFKKNNGSAVAFFQQHLVNSTSWCHYNPHDLSQILFNVPFTAWKWAVSAIFGMVPLALFIGFYSVVELIIPASKCVWGWARAGYQEAIQSSRGRYDNLVYRRDKNRYPPSEEEEDKPPPAYAADDMHS